MKKWSISVVAILTLVGGLALGWWVRDREALSRSLAQVLATEKALSAQYAPVAYAGQDHHYGSPAYLVSPASLEAGLTGMMVGNYQLLTANQPQADVTVIRGQLEPTELVGVSRLVVYQTDYAKAKTGYQLLTSKVITRQHVKDDQTYFTLDDLLSYYGSYAKDRLAASLDGRPDQDVLLSKTFDVDLPTQLQTRGYYSDGFEVKNGLLVFDSGLSLPLSDFYDVLDPSYLQGADLQAYQAATEMEDIE